MKKILFLSIILFTLSVKSQTNYIEELAKLKTQKNSYLNKVDELSVITKEYRDSIKSIERKISQLESYSKIDNDANLHVIGYVKDEETKIFDKPNFKSDILSTLKKGDSIKVLDYYKGKPYTNLLFWVVIIDGNKGYIQERNLTTRDGGNLIFFKAEVDTRNEIVEKKKIAQQKSLELENLKKEKAKDSLERLEFVNSCQYEINGKDKFNGKTEKFTPYYYVNGLGTYSATTIQIQLRRIGQTKYVVIKANSDLGCTSPYDNNQSFVKIKLKNNDIVTFYHRGKIDCEDFSLIGVLTQTDINKLKRSEIQDIRLVGTEYKEDIEITDFNNLFIKKLDCIN